MTAQVPSDDLTSIGEQLVKDCAEHLAIGIQYATRCSPQAAAGIVQTIGMYVDAMIQRERARQIVKR